MADIYGGASKAYNGWKLPSTIILNVWETPGHKVEKYLDEWMLGKKGQKGTGVFDMETGAFQTVMDESVLYRDLVFRTFIYEIEREEAAGVTVKSFAQELKWDVEEMEGYASDLMGRSGELTDKTQSAIINMQQYTKEFKQQLSMVTEKYKTDDNIFGVQKQIIPVLDKLVAAVNGLANQGIAKIPVASNITKRFIPTIRIVPPVMKVPIMQHQINPKNGTKIWEMAKLGNDIGELSRTSSISAIDNIFHYIQQIKAKVSLLPDIRSTRTGEPSGMKSDKVNIGNVKWTARQKTTSETVYNVAIQGYDVGTYDYQSGEGVTYTVNLAVRDIKRTEYPA